MKRQAPSIFNDVLGPIMRGPSSSHVGGAFRIARLIRLAHGAESMVSVLCEFDTEGTQAATHVGHGSDLGFLCGILGVDLTDSRVPEIFEIAKTASILYTIGWNMGTGCHAFFLRPSPVRFPHAPAAPGPEKSTRPFRVRPNPEERKDDPT